MRIGILVFEQSIGSEPEHFVSKRLADECLSYIHNGKRAVVRLQKNLLKIVVPIAFGKLKALLRNFRDHAPHYAAGKPYIPCGLPPSELPGLVFKHESSQQIRVKARMAGRLELWPVLERGVCG